MTFILPQLNYGYDSLDKYISADIMELHHSHHHQTYIDKLNTALAQYPELDNASIEDLLRTAKSLPAEIQEQVHNNGGGHYNHSLFWRWMSPSGGGEPGGDLSRAIADEYGSFQNFVDTFSTAALGVFGSGWCWLMPNLEIITTANQDTPIMSGQPEPILGIDVWEHAYYLDYKYMRVDYIKAWWNVVAWDFVETRFSTFTTQT